MNNKCLYCYKPLPNQSDFHEACAMEFFGQVSAPELPYKLTQMAELAKAVVERRVAVPGVQPKLSMTLVEEEISKAKRLTVVGTLGGNYIFKPPSEDYPELPQNEHLTLRIAGAFKLPVVPASLIRLKSGELGYITKRIDRATDGYKIHMLDMFQIMEAVDKYKGSMEKMGKAIGQYSVNPLLDKLYFLELTIFSFITGNNDMHLKNFSMIESPSGWVLAPAYDLLNATIVLPGDSEELALPIEGKKSKLTRENFEQFGFGLGLTQKQIQRAFMRLEKNLPLATTWIENSFLSDEMKVLYKNILFNRAKRLLQKKLPNGSFLSIKL